MFHLFLALVLASSVQAAEWTQWFNRDQPSGNGDFELLSDIRRENPGKVCEHPLDIQVHHENVLSLATSSVYYITIHRFFGAVCRNNIQRFGGCPDIKVRFLCPKCTWTRYYDRDNPSGKGDYEPLVHLRKENPGQICERPDAIDIELVRPQSGTGNFLQYSAEYGVDCVNGNQCSGIRCKDYKVRFLCCA